MSGYSDEGTGYEEEEFSTVVDRINSRLSSSDYFGEDFPTTPDSGAGQITNIISAEIKDLEQLVSATAEQQNLDTATGQYLDYIGACRGLTRYTAEGSTGTLLFVLAQNTTISANFPCSDADGNTVLTDESYTSNRSECYQAYFTTGTVDGADNYTVAIDNVSYTYSSSSSDTTDDILEGLLQAIEESDPSTYSAEINDDGYLVVTYGSRSNLLSTTNTSNMSLYALGSLVTATSSETGDLEFDADSIVNIDGTNSAIYSVTNPVAFTEGNDAETDAEFRLRIQDAESSTGKATVPAIESALQSVDDVDFAYVAENRTLTTNSDGIPGKAIECYVGGGDSSSIAATIWDTKAAGIQTYGDIAVTIEDDNGNEQEIYYSEPTTLEAWVRVTYTLNSEEDFPSDGEEEIQDAVVDEGDEFTYGDDFDPGKFYGPIYTAVSGIFVNNIEIATTTDSSGDPDWQSTVISISDIEQLSFSTDRVVITTAS